MGEMRSPLDEPDRREAAWYPPRAWAAGRRIVSRHRRKGRRRQTDAGPASIRPGRCPPAQSSASRPPESSCDRPSARRRTARTRGWTRWCCKAVAQGCGDDEPVFWMLSQIRIGFKRPYLLLHQPRSRPVVAMFSRTILELAWSHSTSRGSLAFLAFTSTSGIGFPTPYGRGS